MTLLRNPLDDTLIGQLWYPVIQGSTVTDNPSNGVIQPFQYGRMISGVMFFGDPIVGSSSWFFKFQDGPTNSGPWTDIEDSEFQVLPDVEGTGGYGFKINAGRTNRFVRAIRNITGSPSSIPFNAIYFLSELHVSNHPAIAVQPGYGRLKLNLAP